MDIDCGCYAYRMADTYEVKIPWQGVVEEQYFMPILSMKVEADKKYEIIFWSHVINISGATDESGKDHIQIALANSTIELMGIHFDRLVPALQVQNVLWIRKGCEMEKGDAVINGIVIEEIHIAHEKPFAEAMMRATQQIEEVLMKEDQKRRRLN